jgi:hypothetical protein
VGRVTRSGGSGQAGDGVRAGVSKEVTVELRSEVGKGCSKQTPHTMVKVSRELSARVADHRVE